MYVGEVPDLRGGRCAEVDPELFFPGQGESPVLAKRICAGCEVREGCLQWALRRPGEQGVWGGTTFEERARMRRTRSRQVRRAVADATKEVA